MSTSTASYKGHPLHPILIPLPIGLWIFSLVSDLIFKFGFGSSVWNEVAFYTLAGGIVGNGRSAALVSNRGAIDWLCWPRFDSAAIFAAILDPKIGGHWSVRAAQQSNTSRRYIDNTNVLETEFVTASGKIVVTDFMPVTSEEKKRRLLWPEHELVRQIRCQEGEI